MRTMTCLRELLMVFGCLLVIGASPMAASAEDRALIIGINKYAHLGKDGQLTAAVNDARLIEKLVREQWGFKPEQIKLLLDEAATADGIRKAFDSWLVQGTAPGDRVFFYYSGHGYFVRDKNGDEPDGKDETVVAHDARAHRGVFLNMVTDDDIRRRLKKLKDRSVMVIADSCHSGTITRALDPASLSGASIEKSPRWRVATGGGAASKSLEIEVTKEEFDKLRRVNTIFRNAAGAVAWTAVSATELAQEDVSGVGKNRNSVFTRYFVEGIRNRAADADANGAVSAAELLLFVRRKAKEYCANYRCMSGMTPTFEPAGRELARDMLVWARPDGGPPGGGGAVAPIPPTTIIPVTGAEFGVTLEMLPGQSVKLGEEIKLRVTSTKPGYLIALDVRNDGKVVQLFPSTCSHSERKLRAGAPLTMPDPSYGCVFTATEPGEGKIMAIVAEDNVPLESLLERHKGFDVIANPSAYLGKIAEALLAVWAGDERNRPVKWGLATVEYEIAPK